MDFSVVKSAFGFGGAPKDVVGIDFGASGVRAVRISRTGEGAAVTQAWEAAAPVPDPLPLPRALRARAGAVAVSHPDAVAKLLSIPRPANKLDDVPFADLLGLGDPQAFRLAMEIQDSSAAETHALLAAIPEAAVGAALHPFAQGFPAPQSLELSGLAAVHGILLGNPAFGEQNLILLDLGGEIATVAITIPKRLAFMRQFRIGANTILRKLGESLGMDADTARDAVGDGVVDASDQVRTAFEPLARQIILGRDFVARRHNARASNLYVSGGLFQAPFWLGPLQTALAVEAAIWNPLAALPAAPGALSPEMTARGCRFAAAAGAALAALQETPPS